MDAPTEGLRLLVDEERAQAAEWRSHSEKPTAQTRAALFARYRQKALRIARHEWRKIEGMGLEASDCEQIANEAILRSIDRFDPDRGVPFLSFVRPRMRGAIRNALAKATEARASFSARKRAERERLASLKRQSSEQDGTDSIENLREVIVGMALGFMLEDNAQSEAEFVPSGAPSPYDRAAWAQAIAAMEAKLNELPPQEKSVLDYHYKQGLPFKDVAVLLGLSRGRISQIHGKALSRLRNSLAKFR